MLRQLLLVTVLPVCSLGCFHLPERPVHYSAEEGLTPMKTVKASGDFALYLGDSHKPEIPVRVQEGQSLGFQQADTGQVQAVAGPFKMNLPPETREAWWRRLNYKDD